MRTHVRGFDPSFNAITGLNGSGKSNILDAICFVLGLTNLSSVRASNIQDLIYKRGQAGVTKASVTIVFDNADRERSPVSFENCATITVTRQIAMGGVSKYLINGHKATQQAVQNMFQSVQLNINNPNFLIMQGKITKVLNMKPAEVLSMIEEAAGTRMFEERKERAFRTMAKKDQKVREITALLQEEIKPKLDRLRDEKRAFLEYQKASTELERATRLHKAYEWHTLQRKLAQRTNEGAAQAKARLAAYASDVAAFTRQLGALDDELHKLRGQRDTQLAADGEQDALVQRTKALAHELVEATTQRDFRRTARDEEAAHAADEERALAAAEEALAADTASLAALRDAFAHEKAAHDAVATRAADTDALLQSLLTGLGAEGNDAGHAGFQGQLARAREREAAALSDIQQAQVRREHLERELRTKEPLAQREASASAGLVAELDEARHAAQRAHDAVAALHWDAAHYDTLAQTRTQLEERVAALQTERDALQERLPSALQFTYVPPGGSFDAARVRGLVARLVTLDAAHRAYAPALEAAAGSRLYNVVVDDEQTGSQLLTHGQLKKRVTLIPLRQIQPSVADRRRVEAAKRLAPNRVDLALELVGCDAQVRKALEYVFGQTLVCKDADTARRVTFDAAVQMKSVTIDGDTYDPAGRLAGGSKGSAGPSVLLRMQELAHCERALAEARDALRTHDAEWRTLQDAREAHTRAAEAAELAQHRAELLQTQVDQGRAAALHTEVAQARTALAELAAHTDAARARADEAAADVRRLEREIEEVHADKGGKIERLRADAQALKASLAEHAAELRPHQTRLRQAELALQQRELDRDAARTRAADAADAAAQAARDLEASEQRVAEVQAAADASEAALAEARVALQAFHEELAQLEQAQAAKRQALADAELAQQQLQHELERTEEECASLRRAIDALEQEHTWIATEHPHFGEAGGAYEFAKHDMASVAQTCARLAEQQSGLRRRVNPRVMNMIDNVEKKESGLQHMLTTVLGDKSKIENTIHELDRYKQDALQATFAQVNAAFGDIFAELLPGNYAKLQPPEGKDITHGLEVRVRLGATWKQSLTELSGGQRSLIALSLIMSLLQFKPAPMYILDEIDAALDLSHTQHIGHLFRTRFKGSQFIVVSLKEGLFNNASVVFRARFRDGTSLVERIAQKTPDQDQENAPRPRAVSRQRLGRAEKS